MCTQLKTPEPTIMHLSLQFPGQTHPYLIHWQAGSGHENAAQRPPPFDAVSFLGGYFVRFLCLTVVMYINV
jgi:hypothetical protein